MNVIKNITKRITYSFESLKLEWGYGKWWCNMDWYVFCGTECATLCDVKRGRVCAVARNVERCAMWNEVDPVWAVARNVERCAMWNEVECGL